MPEELNDDGGRIEDTGVFIHLGSKKRRHGGTILQGLELCVTPFFRSHVSAKHVLT